MAVACDRIDKLLKPFLDDLLAETDYRDFVDHIEQCSSCREHVRSIGSFSNQLWNLGEVAVPEDFSATVLFKLRQDPSPAVPVRPRRVFRAAIVFVAVIAAAGAFWWRTHHVRRSELPAPGPVAAEQSLDGLKRSPDTRTAAGVDLLSARTYPRSERIELPGGSETARADNTEEDQPTAVEPALPVPTLHWHFQFSQDSEKRKFLDELSRLYIRPEYQDNDIVVFTVTGTEAEQVIEAVLLAFPGPPRLGDYTLNIPTLPDNMYRVAVYLDQGRSSVLHWHVGKLRAHQKSQLLDSIRERGGRITRDWEGIIVLSIPSTEIDKLKYKVMAMRVGMSGFGASEVKENVLSSGPVKMLIYYTEQ